MKFEWTPDLAVGVEEIDHQNVEWFNRVNGLLTAIENGGGGVEIASALRQLEDYTKAHLTLEESLMQEHGFPGLVAHLLEHREMTQEMAGLKWSLDATRSTTVLAARVRAGMCEWLVRHVRTFDRGLCSFLTQKGIEVRRLAA